MTGRLAVERLAELRTIAEAAESQEPWRTDDDEGRMVFAASGFQVYYALFGSNNGDAEPGDAAHIAAFDPPTALALVAEVERLAELRRIAEAFAQRTQERDWDRLDEALRDAANGTWSMECGWIVGEIVESHAVTGTWTPDADIPYGPILLDGIYEAITGIPVSEDTLAECRDRFARFPERRVLAGSAAEAKNAARSRPDHAGLSWLLSDATPGSTCPARACPCHTARAASPSAHAAACGCGCSVACSGDPDTERSPRSDRMKAASVVPETPPEA